ncbi:hypothetical protein EfmJHP36_02550 [Enterococcus faecium]|nr:hypothetical protein EfmJHP36_02550 [Enterococcus faecium]
MYVVKVMHGYIDKTGCRTRGKKLRQSAHFQRQKESEAFAKRIGVSRLLQLIQGKLLIPLMAYFIMKQI